MSGKNLIFQKINIESMPGLRNGLKSIDGLSPQINIIAGPNASGKSSTARVIQGMIWENSQQSIKADADGCIGEDIWKFVINSSYRKVQKNGNDSSLSRIPSQESKRQYMLSLHDLIRVDEKGLAARIQKESIGGYDVEQARRTLDYKPSKSSRGVPEFREYKEAAERADKISGEQIRLRKREEQLKDLIKKRDEAAEAKKKFEFFTLWKEYIDKSLQKESLKEAVSDYPQVMPKVKEDDFTNVEKLENEISSLKKEILEIRSEMEKISGSIEKLNLPAGGVEDSDFRSVKYSIEKLREIDITSREAEIEDLKEKKNQAAVDLDETLEKESFAGVDLSDIYLLDDFWQNAFDIYGKKRLLSREIETIKKEMNGTADSHLISTGINELSKWLKTGYEFVRYSIPVWVWILLFFVSVATSVAVQFIGPAGYIGILLLTALLFYAYKKSSSNVESNSDTRVSDYKQTGLEVPQSWNVEGVSARLESLVEELHQAKRQEWLGSLLQEKAQELEKVNEEIRSVDENLGKLREKIKGIPALQDKNFENYSSLFWILSRLRKWAEFNTELSGREKAYEKFRSDFDRELRNCNNVFLKYKLEEAKDDVRVKSTFDELSDKRDAVNDFQRKLDNHEADIKRFKSQLAENEAELNTIYDRLHIEPADKFIVKELTERISGYRELKEKIRSADRQMAELTTKLKQKEAFDEFKDQLDEVQAEDIEGWIRENEIVAQTWTDLTAEIASITTLVDKAKAENNLEEAVVKKEEALIKLEELYRKNAASITGSIIVDKVKEHIGKKNMPVVFERAKGLFSRITKGRYELTVAGVDDPEFRAIDTLDGIGRKLDELSTGTKIQLLMSVRLAFIEELETELKLPVLADELLANSDDQRAEAIIDALVEISRAGRQIFYFTAQRDEVLKWKSSLEKHNGVELNIHRLQPKGTVASINLAKQHRQTEGIQVFDHQIPKPKSGSYSDYKSEINVPDFNLLLDDVEQIHLWYLFNDAEILYRVLSYGIDRWGAFENFISSGGSIPGLTESEIGILRIKAKIIEKYAELSRHGHDRPISRLVLEKYDNVISGTFIDRVSEKMEEYDYNPSALIHALRRGEVSRFQEENKDKLEQYFTDDGYISDAEPYSKGEIQSKLTAFVSILNVDREEVQEMIDRLTGE